MVTFFKDLGTIGKCIYCGVAEKLFDEHIFPYGLGGGYVLRKASCQKCANITSQFERNVLKYSFGPARAVLNLPTRRKHPENFSLKIIKKSGEEEIIEISTKQYVDLKIFPIFSPPSYFINRDSPNTIEDWLITGKNAKSLKNLLDSLYKKYGAQKISLELLCNPFDFARMIAKIAYGFSVAKFGLSKIKKKLYFIGNMW